MVAADGTVLLELVKEAWAESGVWQEGGESGTWSEVTKSCSGTCVRAAPRR